MSGQAEKRDYYEENSFLEANYGAGELWGFNVEHGYLEAIVRGFRSGFLTDSEYRQLGQCASLEDIKLCFNDTDYVGVLESIDKGGDDATLTVEMIAEQCYGKFVDEFTFLRNQATGALATFLNFLQYEYMIKNVMYLITGLVNGNDGKFLLDKVDRLGTFPRMASILTFENTDEGFLDLYRTVLVDVPIGKYFEMYFKEKAAQGPNRSISQIKNIMEESEVEVIKEHIQKYWLEDFWKYCQKLGGMTAEIMIPLLEFRADMRAINIMLNSFDTHLNDPIERDNRQELFCAFGTLYPDGIAQMNEIANEQDLFRVLDGYKDFSRLINKAQNRAQDGKDSDETWVDTLPDVLLEEDTFRNALAFEQQSHFACFYAFVQLKMQEKRNIYWIAECISQKQRQAVDKYVAPFSLTCKDMA